MQFMPPADQQRLRECMRHASFLDELLALAGSTRATTGSSAMHALISSSAICSDDCQRSITMTREALHRSSGDGLGAAHLEDITASGPPLPVLLRSLEVLRDMRLAANRPGIATRHADFEHLRSMVADRP